MEIKKKWDDFVRKLESIPVNKTNLADVLIKALYFVVLTLGIVLMFSGGKTTSTAEWKVGSIATKKVVAPFNFYVLKTQEELQKEQQEKTNTVPYYFNYQDSITYQQLKRIRKLLPFLIGYEKRFKAARTPEVQDTLLFKLKDELRQNFDIRFSKANLRVLLDILAKPQHVEHLKVALKIASDYMKNGILNLNLSEITRPNVIVIRHGIEENLPEDQRMDLPSALKNIENELLKVFDVNQTVILNYLFSQLLQPNLIYDQALTEQRIEDVLANISRTKDMVYKNERIVDANERIDQNIYQKLYSLQMARIERSREKGNWPERIGFLARLMLISAILFVAGLYLASFRKDIYQDNKTLLMIGTILMLLMIIAALIIRTLDWHIFLVPTTLVSMLLAILVDSGIALWGTVIVALILGGVQGGGYDLSLLSIVAGLVGIYSVHQIRNRNQVFKAVIYIAAAYFWVYIGITALRFESLTEGLRIFAFYLLPNSVFSPLIAFMILGVFEKSFDITTDVTLLELSDLNHPLLKRLSLEAPGTFHHSMVVGNLAEAAAKAIGANPLLVRVGSYFHDIGKIEKPEYFVENQMDAENRHNQLSPNMSALILASHVKNGIEMAKRYGIPKRIRDFIPEHHGTNIMKYFYDKALKNASENEVNDADFRYPGPKPQSKETAIVMLADAVEAATRTVQNPTPNKLRAFVEKLVDERFREGELDESDLTLRDLKNIVDAFMPVLYGIFQHRIEYPDQEKKKSNEKVKPKKEKAVKDGNPHPPAAENKSDRKPA
ncbi:MAG TPA: HDIG domain-containing protein [Caldithrix abyssi]|uniref:HDIG domain-containing protein n=1 Tax=Caldithrix abyssi TaxID=187145 RepID=A0A7V5UEH1_CALAY|nr:HDIG domain-containing protein [Caldithrix abyssi]